MVLLQAAKYPDKLDKLFILQNFANLQGIGFKINRDSNKDGLFYALRLESTTDQSVNPKQ